MAEFPYFTFYPNDFAADGNVEAMSTEEVGAYILLLCKAWNQQTPGSLPDDDTILARWARLDLPRWLDCKPHVLICFAQSTDGRWHQKRMQAEHRKLRSRSSRLKQAGKEGATRRWHSQAIGHPIGEAIASHIQSQNQTKELIPLPPLLDFADFRVALEEWIVYRRESKKSLTPETLKRQIKRLASYGKEKAIASINESITNGWTGLFDPGASRASGPVGQSSRIRAPEGKYAGLGTTIRYDEAADATGPTNGTPAANPAQHRTNHA